MVILRQERIFFHVGRGKFADVWMIIAYDANGPSIDLYKNETAKKLIGTKLHIPSLANQIRFGTTCRLYGNLPEIKPDPKIDRSCLMAFQIERRVKKAVQPQLLWLCAESTKQMFAIMKILACGLTIMALPAPPPNTDPNDPFALHHYRPRILQPTNDWERFWDNPPAGLVSPEELARNVSRSMDALNVVVAQQQTQPGIPPQPVTIVPKSKSTPELESLRDRQQTVPVLSRVSSRASSRASSTSRTSSRSTISRSLSGRKRVKPIRVWQLSYTKDMPQIPYSPQKVRKYERQESARSSPLVIRQRQQKRIVAPEPPPLFEKEESGHKSVVTSQPYESHESYEVQRPVKTVPTAPPLPSQLVVHPMPVCEEIHLYDRPPSEDELQEEEESDRHIYHPSQHIHRRHLVEHSPSSILKHQPSEQQTHESPPHKQRPVSGYSSSTYGSGHVTPLGVQPPKREFELEILRQMSDISLRPLSRTLTSPTIQLPRYEPIVQKSPPTQHKEPEHHYHEIVPHREELLPLIAEENKPIEEPKKMSLLEQSTIPLRAEHRISDPEYFTKPRRSVKRRAKHRRRYISQGVQTDHELSSVPLIENFDFAQTKQFTYESHEPHLHHYRKLSQQSSRSIYVQHVDISNDYETVRPFFRTSCTSSSECSYEEETYDRKPKSEHSNDPILINDSLGTRTYTVDVDDSAVSGLF